MEQFGQRKQSLKRKKKVKKNNVVLKFRIRKSQAYETEIDAYFEVINHNFCIYSVFQIKMAGNEKFTELASNLGKKSVFVLSISFFTIF